MVIKNRETIFSSVRQSKLKPKSEFQSIIQQASPEPHPTIYPKNRSMYLIAPFFTHYIFMSQVDAHQWKSNILSNNS